MWRREAGQSRRLKFDANNHCSLQNLYQIMTLFLEIRSQREVRKGNKLLAPNVHREYSEQGRPTKFCDRYSKAYKIVLMVCQNVKNILKTEY